VIVALIEEAVHAGARLEPACEQLGLTSRSIQRWQGQAGGEDRRSGPHRDPANKLSDVERKDVLRIANSEQFRDVSPKQIVPRLADCGIYVASESTFYRILRAEGQMTHREHARPPTHSRPREHVATGPGQVWSWDITYMHSARRGSFYYLYMIEDVWSRKIVGWEVYEEESMELAAELMERICEQMGIAQEGLVLHSDNGGPMKGSTMLATLQRLGVVPSFSRPRVNDDNPFSEALFRTMKYRPHYPRRPSESIEQARAWVARFVQWYNTEHLHSAIRFVTPDDRHYGRQEEILARRRKVYEAARRQNPNRWSGTVRNWEPVQTVYLNPAGDINIVRNIQFAA
jgi:putative transposase